MIDTITDRMRALTIDTYVIELTPDFETNTFRGTEKISGSVEAETAEIELHARDIQISRFRCNGADAVAIDFSTDDQIVRVKPASVVSGSVEIEIEFSGILNDLLVGFYRSGMGDGVCAATQFEERDARRAFPCIDHPSRRSVFDISLVAPEGMSAISNTGVASVEDLDGGSRRYCFHPTPLMPTYLLFFGIGAYEIIEDASFRIPVRVATTQGKAKLGLKAIEYAGKSVDFLEAYTGVAYPLDKLDLIGVEDFAYGAMENFGAITYRESYLYLDEEASSQADLEGVAGVGAHEVAHMWFGDLVSPADWGYVWLNEAFATYFGNLIVDYYHPDWGVLDGFVAGTHGGTMERDSLADTVPIEFKAGTFTDIDPSNSPILYGKAGALLHMIRDFAGDDRFKSGVKSFLESHAYTSATTDDFLSSFGSGAGSDISDVLERWIRRPGIPIVSARRDGTTLELEQRRFILVDPQTRLEAESPWPIPLTVLLLSESGEFTRIERVFDALHDRIEIPDETVAYKINARNAGLYRADYDDASFADLCRSYDRFPVSDRAGLAGDLGALHLEGTVNLSDVFSFVDAVGPTESEERPLRGITSLLSRCLSLIPHEREALSSRIIALLEPHLARLGTDLREDDTVPDRRLRTDLLWLMYRAGHREVSDSLRALARRATSDGKVAADHHTLALRVAAWEGIVDSAWLETRIDDSSTSEAVRRYTLQALGWFSDPKQIVRALDYTMSDIPPKNRHFPVQAAAGNPAAREFLLPWLERSVPELGRMQSYASARIVAYAVPYAGIGKIDRALELVENTLRTVVTPGPLNMAIERMGVLDRFVTRNHEESNADTKENR